MNLIVAVEDAVKPIPKTFSFSQMKSRPGVYKLVNGGEAERFIIHKSIYEQFIRFYVLINVVEILDMSVWIGDEFEEVFEKITLTFDNAAV
jgi:hypothetical protein